MIIYRNALQLHAGTTDKMNADTGQSTYAGNVETSNIDMQTCVAYKSVKGLMEEDKVYCTVRIS